MGLTYLSNQMTKVPLVPVFKFHECFDVFLGKKNYCNAQMVAALLPDGGALVSFLDMKS